MADATRNVTYNLQIVYDEQKSRAALDSFKRAQSESDQAEKKRLDAVKKAAEEQAAAAKKVADEQEKAARKAAKEQEKAAKEAAKAVKEAEKEKEKAAKQAAKEAEKAAKAAEKAAKEQAKAAKEAAKEAEKAAREAEKAAKEAEKREAKIFQNRMKILAQIAEKRRRDEENALAQHQTAIGQMQASQDKFRLSVLATSDAVLRVGRGLALLGASGGDNLKKMLDALVKIQAVFDVTKGGIELYYNISEAVKAYRQSVLAAAAAEEALGAARAKSATGGVAAAGAGRAGAAGAGLAGGAAAGVGAGVAVAGAVAGALAAVVAVSEALRGTSTQMGSFSRSIYDFGDGLVSATAALLGYQTSLSKMLDSEKETALANERVINVTNENMRVQQEISRYRSIQTIEAGGETFGGLNDMTSRRASFMGDAAAGNRAALIGVANRINSVNASRRAAAAPGSGASVDEILALNNQAESLAERQIQLTEERITLERLSAKEKQDAARVAIAAAETELKAARDALKVEKERQMSALERFGQLSTAEQRQLLAVRTRVDIVGAENLSRKEREQLRSIGTNSAERLAREGDIAAARRAGGGGLFRAEDFAAESAARERVRQASVTIQDQRRIEVQVEADLQQVTDEVTKIFEVQYAKLERLIAQNIRDAAERETTLFQARQTEAQAARMQSVR